jgi:putative transposase
VHRNHFNFLGCPTDIVLLVVLWRLRYKLSLCDLVEMFLERGFVFTHEAVCEWEKWLAPLPTEQLRVKRWRTAGRSRYVNETHSKVHARSCYLYRAIDRDGTLVDSLPSETRDRKAAQRFFHGARAVVDHAPDRVTTDGHDAYPRPVRRTLGRKVVHRRSRYLNNRLEQDHRGIKQWYNPTPRLLPAPRDGRGDRVAGRTTSALSRSLGRSAEADGGGIANLRNQPG